MAKKKGNQKPTVAVVLPYKHSRYKDAIKHYQQSKRTAQKWQQDLLASIMAYNGEGLWTHTKFGYSLPRRNGKNEVVAMRELWGLMNGEQMLHTAHRTSTSHAAWERLMRILDEAKIPYSSLKAVGRERIEVLDGGRIEFRTRTSTGGLGEGFDLLVIDEAQEYTTDQETALKYVVTDSKNPQTIFCGTPPTPISSGTVFPDLRKMALNGETKNTGWAEWSVPEVTDVYNREAWYQTNPSLGTILTERAVEDEIGSDTTDFNIQRLGLWIKYNQKSAISITEWQELETKKLPELTGKLFAGVKFGVTGENVALAIAVKTEDGEIFVEAVDCRAVRTGTTWLLEFCKKAKALQQIVIDGAGQQDILAKELKDEGIRTYHLPTVKEVITANAIFERAIYAKTLVHIGQPSLTQVISNCEKRNIGTNGGFGYRAQIEDHEIALMDSIILAHWACALAKAPIKQKVGY